METQNEYFTQRVVYIGQRRFNEEKKMYHRYMRINADGSLSDEIVTLAKPIKPFTIVGAVIDIQTNGTSYKLNNAIYATSFADEKQVAIWQAEDRTARLFVRQLKEAQSDNQNKVREMLKPLRAVYQELSYDERTLFVADLINYVTGRK